MSERLVHSEDVLGESPATQSPGRTPDSPRRRTTVALGLGVAALAGAAALAGGSADQASALIEPPNTTCCPVYQMGEM